MPEYRASKGLDLDHLWPPGWASWQEYAAWRLQGDPEVAVSFPLEMSSIYSRGANEIRLEEDMRQGHGVWVARDLPRTRTNLDAMGWYDPWLLETVWM